MPIRVIIAGDTAAITELRQLPEKLERAVLARMSVVAFDAALNGIDRHTKTGRLRASLYNRNIPGGREVGNDPQAAPHAVFVHWGTRPHEIRPKNKRALRWASGGAFVFARKVNHPGYRGDPYMISAADEAVRQFASIVDAAFKESA